MLKEVEITSLAHGGDGIGRVNGQVYFVARGLPGDVLRVRMRKTGASAIWADIDEILEPSPHRQKPECPNFGDCGVCTWGHFAYPAQAEWKQRIVREQLQRIGGIDVDLKWLEEPSLRNGYRTRAELHGDGQRLGFFARKSHRIVDTAYCPLCHERLNRQLPRLREMGIKGSVTVTVNPEGEEVLVWTKFVKRKLKAYFPLAQSPQDGPRRTMFDFDGVPVVNGAFSQSSLLLNRLLVGEVHRMVGKPPTLLDLYCGSGNLSLTLPQEVQVTGVDHSKNAVDAAQRLRKSPYRAGGENVMRRLIQEESWDTIVLDPPRTGAKAVVPKLAESNARTIVYVSCDPATLARDVKMLSDAGWGLEEATAIDLFPHTSHVETVCRLRRRGA